MKVIKPGDLGRLDVTRRFACTRCGCVFEASGAEYRKEPDYRNGSYLVCNCPTCGYRVTRDEEEKR